MVGAERDSTQDWLLPEDKAPPTLGELEGRIEEALTTARASEAAVMTVGAAALDAAEQARRAAGLAGGARAMVADAREPDAPTAVATAATEAAPAPMAPSPAPGDASLKDFSERADRLVARLRQL